MNRIVFLSRKESIIIQGIAAMLMVFHHLFGFPDRIHSEYIIISDLLGSIGLAHIGTMFAYFGRICISIFAFCSGYGLYIKLSNIYSEKLFNNIKNGYKCIVKQALKFMSRYWVVCAIFIPIGYFMGIFSFDFASLLKCLLGISCPYNAEWWYVGYYLEFLLIVPLFVAFEKLIVTHLSSLIMNIIYIIIFIVSFVFSLLGINNFSTMLCFLSGIACASTRIFDIIFSRLIKLNIFKYLFSITILFILVFGRIILSLNCDYDYLCAPIFVFGMSIIIKSKLFTKYINKALLFIGKYSTYIWLTHTFFGYYYFQEYLFCFRYSTIIFIVCLVCCILVGIVIELIIKQFLKLFSKDKSVKSNA